MTYKMETTTDNIFGRREDESHFPATQEQLFEYLPARSRSTVYIPHRMEVSLPSPSPVPSVTFEKLQTICAAQQSTNTAADFLKNLNTNDDRSRSARDTATLAANVTGGVNITNNTTVLVVDVPLKPVEKLRRAVKKMQRFSRKETNFSRYGDGLNTIPRSSTDTRNTTDSNRHVSRYDGGRSSLRLERGRRVGAGAQINSDAISAAANKTDMDVSQLARENINLKHRLEEDEANYRRKLDTYRLAQQHQATLVSRLQSKVLQYKKRCSDLEGEIKENLPLFDSIKTYKPISTGGSALDAAQQHLRESQEEPVLDFESALRRLNEEQTRNEKLSKLNVALRDQLQESQQTNEALTNDLQKLACDWQQMRDEMVEKEEEWKEEEQFFNDYYNTEHCRMVNLWKDVVAMKRNFAEVKSATQRDLNKLRNEVNCVSNDMVETCSGLMTNAAQSITTGKQQELKKENHELQSKLNKLKKDHDNVLEQLHSKEENIRQMSKEIQNLNKKMAETDEHAQEMAELQDQVKLLLNGMNEIAQTVLHEVDSKETDIIRALPHLHLSSAMSPPARSQTADDVLKMHATAAFAESTISGVQAALFKYQSHIHELQVKLSSLSEQLLAADKQNETQLEFQRKLTDKLNDQNDELDSLRAELNLLGQEKESLVKALDLTRMEKSTMEKNRFEISNMLEAVNTDYEKILKSNNRLQKIVLNLEDEKNLFQNEVDRLTKELETREVSYRMTEDRCSQMLNECLTIKEELSKVKLDKELIEQNRAEAQSVVVYLENAKGQLEAELQNVLVERTQVHDTLAKLESRIIALEEERNKLSDELKTEKDLKIRLQTQLVDTNNDLGAVRKELLRTEQNRLDLETEKIALFERCKFLEAEKEKVEIELGHTTQERNEFSDQLLNMERKTEILNDELLRLRHRIEQVGEANARVNKHLEGLVKECEEKQVMLESNEKEITHLGELNLVLKGDKESLETMLFETQTNLESSEMRRETMEKDIQDLLSRQDSLKEMIGRLEKQLEDAEKSNAAIRVDLSQQLTSLEIEYKQKLENLKTQHDESLKRLELEKDQIRCNLEKKLLVTVSEVETEKTEELGQLQKKLDNLNQQIETQNQQYEEALRRAESDKQQALLLAHQDQKAMLERMETIRVELDEERLANEKLRRETHLKAEQDRSNINTLRDQVTRLTSKMEDTRIKIEDEKQKYDKEIEDLKKEREFHVKQREELEIELSLCEDRFENVKLQLLETNHKLKESEKQADHLKRELNDGKRQLNECCIEKEKYLASNKELRDFIKKSEAEKREQARSLEESHQKIAALDDKICQLENEKARLQNVCRETECKLTQSNQNSQTLHYELEKSAAANLQKENDQKELMNKLSIELEDKEKLQEELHMYKKQLFEAERNIDANEQELMKIRQRVRNDEEQWRLREQELIARLEEGRGKERKLEDQKHNLELCLTDANQQLQDIKARLGGSEGRIRALDTQLTQLEGTKRELENRLKAIGNIFRRLNVIQQEGLLSTSLRMVAPMRRWSPSRAGPDSVFESSRTDNALEVDPECIKKTIQLLLQQMAQLERERDDLKIQVANVKKQLDETYEVQNKNETKISSMVQCIRHLNEEKGALEVNLDQKESSLINESDMLKQKIDENLQLREKIVSLEHHVQGGSEEKNQLEERIVKLRNVNSQLEIDRQKLRDDLTRCESRSARLEIQRIALEGDLNRLQMILQEKDSHIQKLQDRLDVQTRAVVNLEEKCDTLQSTIDQLNSSLEIANSVEADLRAEILSLQKSLSDCTYTSHSTNDKIKQLQKTLSNNDNERRLLAERLERAERALQELHGECKARGDQLNSLQSELDAKEIQRARLEDQLRFARYSTAVVEDKETSLTIPKLQIDCCELRGKVEMLEEKLRRVEADKKLLEKKLNVERTRITFDKEPNDIFQQSNLVSNVGSVVNLSYLEHENKDLKQNCNKLEAQLAEKETELARLRVRDFSRSDDLERLRAAQLRAEHLLKAREQSHKQQMNHMKNEINNLRKRLDQEMKLKRRYLMQGTGENSQIRQLRETIADSLRTVSQNPTLDALLLDREMKEP